MRIIVDRALFEVQSETEALALLDLFIAVKRDGDFHALITNPPYVPGGDNGPLDNWLANRARLETNAFRSLLEQGLLRNAGIQAKSTTARRSEPDEPRRWHLEGSLTVRVERRQDSDWKSRLLTAADAVELLREPVHLVLENERTDLAFVRFLAGPTDGAKLQSLVNRPGWIHVHGGGGGEGKKWLEALRQTPPTATIWRRLLRTWVLFDRDAGVQSVLELSRTAIALMKLCEQITSTHGAGLTWICLGRRDST